MTNPAEFNLSEKIDTCICSKQDELIYVEDVKEFIRLLKEKTRLRSNVELIDKLAGEKLK